MFLLSPSSRPKLSQRDWARLAAIEKFVPAKRE